MIEVYEIVTENVMGPSGPGTMYECIVPSRPEVNSGSFNPTQAHNWIVDSWNRQFPEESKVLADFEFKTPPEGWVNPNT